MSRRSQVVASVIGPVCVFLAQGASGATEEQVRKAYENCVAYNVHFARAETEDEALQWAVDRGARQRMSGAAAHVLRNVRRALSREGQVLQQRLRRRPTALSRN